MIVLGAVGDYPAKEAVHIIVGILIAYAYLLHGHLLYFSMLQGINNLVQGSLVREAFLKVLLYVQAYDGQVFLDVTALQVEDIGQCVE